MALVPDLSPLKHLGKLVEELPKDLEPLKALPEQMEQMVTILRNIDKNIQTLVQLGVG